MNSLTNAQRVAARREAASRLDAAVNEMWAAAPASRRKIDNLGNRWVFTATNGWWMACDAIERGYVVAFAVAS